MSGNDDDFVAATEGNGANSNPESSSRTRKKTRWCYSRFWIDCTGTFRCRPSFRAVDKIYKTDGSLEVKIIDVAASFSPPSSAGGSGSTHARLAVALWKLAVVGIHWYSLAIEFFREPYPFYFAFLTNWGLILSMVYSHLSLANSLFPIENRDERKQTNDADEGLVSFRVRLTWAFFFLGAWLQMVVTVLYWALIYDGGPSETYNILAHGVVFVLVWIDGLVVNRIPVRMRHWLELGFPFLLLYTGWTVLQARVLDLSNPYHDYYLIYPILDWKDSPWFTLGLVSGLMLVFSPIVQVLLWGASLLGRRYVDGSTPADNAGDASNKSAKSNGDAVVDDEDIPI